MCTCSLFFCCHSFSPWWLLAFLIFSLPLQNVCYSSNGIYLLCFLISHSSSFSVVHINVDIKVKSKERIGFVVGVFLL